MKRVRMKFAILTFLCALALIVPHSAYAFPGADTRETAVVISAPFNFTTYLTNYADEDWYRWTNNTGTVKIVHLSVASIYYGSNFNLYSEIIYPDGSVNVIGYAYDDRDSGYDYYNIMVYPGQTLLFKVDRGYEGATGVDYPYLVQLWFIGE